MGHGIWISTKSAPNQSSKVEKNKTTVTEEKSSNLIGNYEGTEPGISAKSSRNQSSKVEKNKTTDTEENVPYLFRKDGARNLGSQQNQRKTNLAKLKKTKLLTQTRKLLTRYAKTGHGIWDLNKIRAKPI